MSFACGYMCYIYNVDKFDRWLYPSLWSETESAIGALSGTSRTTMPLQQILLLSISPLSSDKQIQFTLKCHCKIKPLSLILVRMTNIVNQFVEMTIREMFDILVGKSHKIHQNICEQVMGQFIIIYAEGEWYKNSTLLKILTIWVTFLLNKHANNL